MRWFHDVPHHVTIAPGLDFLTASEAIWETEPGDIDPWHERPSEDFGAAAVLAIAKFQLDQMLEVLDRPELRQDGRDLGSALQGITVVEGGDNPDGMFDPSHDLACVKEAMHLRESLPGSVEVSHGFAPDGSITITIGPSIPESAALRLRGGEQGEMHDTPVKILDAAVYATRAAARIIYGLWRGDGNTIARRSYP